MLASAVFWPMRLWKYSTTMRKVQMAIIDTIHSTSMRYLAGRMNRSATSRSGMATSAWKPRRTSVGYMSSNLAARCRNTWR